MNSKFDTSGVDRKEKSVEPTFLKQDRRKEDEKIGYYLIGDQAFIIKTLCCRGCKGNV